MSRSLNKAMLIGYVGQDPELRYTNSGTAVASFSIATSESWTSADGQKVEKTEWHNLVAWKKLAEIVGEYVKKGSKLFVEGRIQHRAYEDKNGVKRYVTEIVLDQMLMLDSRERSSVGAGASPAAPAEQGAPEKLDDLPF